MPEGQRSVIGGVDTHRDSHVAAVIDAAGRLLGTASFAATGAGCGELLGWMRGWGDVERVGVEGTGSYGAGPARHLAAAGVATVEVIRPSRRAWSSSAAATWRSATGTGRRDLAAGSRRRT